jgi:transcriptional regulator with XRE-family HTH domain
MSTTRDLKAISYANYSEARDAKGLNNSQVAEMAKIPSSTIYDWAASRYMPKADKLLAIAKVLDIPLEKILEE